MTKQELLKLVRNTDLKYAIAEITDTNLINLLSNAIGRTELKVEEFNEKGLFYKNKDFYIYKGRGGLKIEETPKGIRKMLLYLSEKYKRRIVISDGVLYQGDKVSITTDGLIDTINIIRDTSAMLSGEASIVAPYAVISIMNKKDKVVTKKFIVVPSNEFKNASKNSGNVMNTYPTMMATKLVNKRALTQVYSLLGSGIDSDDADMLDETIEGQNIDGLEPETSKKKISKDQIKWIEDKLKNLDKEKFLNWLKSIDRVSKIEDINQAFFKDVETRINSAIKDKNNKEKKDA